MFPQASKQECPHGDRSLQVVLGRLEGDLPVEVIA
jgi:hypothetical protein